MTTPSSSGPEKPYFAAFLDRMPPPNPSFTARQRNLWHVLAGLTIGLGLWYLGWRWTASLNPDAMVFSVTIALAETMAFTGTLLFFFNIWDEGDSERRPPPETRSDVDLEDSGTILIDIFIATFDEDTNIVSLSVDAAKETIAPPNVAISVHVLDDGARSVMRQMALDKGVGYLERDNNRGYKAGNLANALFATDGDFVVICDADTQLFPNFLQDTLGYFRDPQVAWVQTPHWFYDIPEGRPWADWLTTRFGRTTRGLAPLMRWLTGRNSVGSNPFLSDPGMFFDVIQRRRNRHGASFCCGAGSIHRREAIFANALEEQGRDLTRAQSLIRHETGPGLLPQIDMQPFQYHVSEDIFTSLQQHSKGWRSVYHPDVSMRMLSPWTMRAWAIQKLKYAGGTYDIMFKSGLIFRSGIPWRTKLHYLATFWSYLAVFWLTALFVAPLVSLIFGIAPVSAYSIEFFIHLIPLLIMNELAMSVGCKGHDIHAGRILSLATLNIQWRGMMQVFAGQKPHFPPTPKSLVASDNLRYATSIFVALGVIGATAVYGIYAYLSGSPAHSGSLVLVNLFWLSINTLALIRVAAAAFWRPCLPDGTLLKPVT